MKKIFSTIILAMALIIPLAVVQAADVPDFADFGGYFKYQEKKDGRTAYFYEFSDANDAISALDRYCDVLESGYPFYLSDHYVNYGNNSGRFIAAAGFYTYTGSKNVSTFRVRGNGEYHYCNLTVKVTSRGNVSIQVADGLEYEGDTGIYSSGNGGDEPCPRCRGSGRCYECGGSGRVTKWGGDRDYHDLTCTSCGGMGTCSWCHGSGKA